MNFKVDINVCRVCMKSENGISLLKDTGLLDKFVYTTKLKVKADDSMPAILCEKCIGRLKVAYDFCRSANMSEKHLRQFISKISNDFEEVTKTLPSEDEDTSNFVVMEEFEPMDQVLLEEAEDIAPAPAPALEPLPPLPPPLIEETSKQLNLKVESVEDETESIELMVEEQQQQQQQQQEHDLVGKQEVFGSDAQMEEFHEIIQDDECDTNLYLDENSYEELQLYEAENGEFYEDPHGEEERDVEGEIVAHHLDVLSGSEGADDSVKFTTQEQKITKPKKTTRTTKKLSGESAASKIEGKSNICIKCNKDFSTKTNLMRHMNTHNGGKPYKCTTCGKGFTQNGSLKQHMFIHTGERPHVCHVCQRGFTQSKSLIFHMRRHTGEKPFNCEECGINFRQKDGLKHHIQKYHGEGQLKREAHVCPVCERVLSTKYALAAHVKKHESKPDEQESEEVTDCVDENIKLEKATAQLLKVQDNKDYLGVPIAQYSTQATQVVIVSEELEQKTISHAGAGIRMKQFQCGKCFKSFHIKRNLLRHLRNHDVSTLELHECTDCGIGFDTKRSLKLHRLRDHKDEILDLNSCEYCNEPFMSVADLSEHIAIEHDAIDQNCPHCNEHFDSQKLYYDHLLEHEHLLDN